MQTGTPIAQFALLREIEVKSEDEREITLREVSGAREAEPGLHDLSMQARESWPGSWSLTSIRVTPVFPAPWGEAPDSEEEYWRRVDAMVARARSAGLLDAERLRQPPVGWLALVERAVTGLGALMTQEADRPVAIRVVQLKEKFGTLRLNIDAVGTRNARASAFQIASWAELCSENRCMLTGRPGTLRRGSWLLTLSDEAAMLRRADPAAFSLRLYPNRR